MVAWVKPYLKIHTSGPLTQRTHSSVGCVYLFIFIFFLHQGEMALIIQNPQTPECISGLLFSLAFALGSKLIFSSKSHILKAVVLECRNT